MSRSLRLYITGLVGASALALLLTSFVFAPRTDLILGMRPEISIDPSNLSDLNVILGVAFWTLVTFFAGALPVRMPRGTMVSVALAPIIAAMTLSGPVAAGWVALVGTTELREVRGRIPWYGTAANHACAILPALVGSLVCEFVRGDSRDLLQMLIATMLGATALFFLNLALASLVVSLRTHQSLRVVLTGDARGFGANLLALTPLAWLMSLSYHVAWWAALLFALPLYTTRMAYHQFIEMREMFTQTIGALAGAVDKRDPYTSKHSHRVKQIAVDIGREMSVSSQELEALEWGGLLHDVGKIGVPDNVLLKNDRLTRDERMTM